MGKQLCVFELIKALKTECTCLIFKKNLSVAVLIIIFCHYAQIFASIFNMKIKI